MDVAQILLSAQSPDPVIRQQAETLLKSACDADFPSFMQTLANHLATEAADPESRRLAGLIIKNNLDAKDTALRVAYHERWTRLDATHLKPALRTQFLIALASPAHQPRRAAAQVIAKVAAIELPVPGTWDSLIQDLLNSSTAQSSPDHLRQAALETLGYICEDAAHGNIAAQVLTAHSNQILTAVVHGMTYKLHEAQPTGDPSAVPATAAPLAATPNGTSTNGTAAATPTDHGHTPSDAQSAADVRFAATVALNNAIEFARAQFEVDEERKLIMQTVYTAAKSPDVRTRQTAFECLVKIGENYYDKLPLFIQWLYELTENAIRTDEDPVALQAIEFWSTIAEEEVALMDEADLSRELGADPERTSKQFVVTALPYLIQSIFQCLKMQDDDPLDDEIWNRATAAATCLEVLAQAAPNQILQLCIPFIESNIGDKDNWRSREAAILTFGSILDGPPVEAVKSLVQTAIGVLMNTLVTDPSVPVRDTTAWTLARVVQVDNATTVACLPQLVECLRSALAKAENPVVAAHICYAVNNLAECFLHEAENETGPLRDYAEVLLRLLISAINRDDAGEGHLRTTAYEALNMVLRSVSRDSLPFVQSCLPMLLEKLEFSLAQMKDDLMEDDLMELLETQGLLCGALTATTQRLQHSQTLEQFADRMMTAYLQVFSINSSAGAHEEALLAVGVLVDAIGPQFQKYMQHFMPPLSSALANHDNYQVCAMATSVVGDLCRTLGQQFMVFADNIVYLLLEALQSSTLDRSVKPPILVCFGDIAMAGGSRFEKYLPQVMTRMQQAATSSVSLEAPADDYDLQDWLLLLRESIFDAYVGIVIGLRDDNAQEALTPYVEWLLQFCEVVVSPEFPQGQVGAERLLKAATGVLGDLVDALPSIKSDLRQRQWIRELLERGGQSKDTTTRETATYAAQAILHTR